MIFNVKTQSAALKIWKQERLVAYIEAHSQAETSILFWSDLHGSQSSPFATYKTQADGKCYIDLTDYVRAFPSVTKLRFYDSSNTTMYEVTCSVVGLINPVQLLIPAHALDNNFAVIPPSRMIEPFSSVPLKVGVFVSGSYWFRDFSMQDRQKTNDGATIPYSWQGGFYLSVQNNSQWVNLLTYTYAQRICGVTYAMVRWESVTGATRCHVLELRKNTIASASNYSLLPIDNEYITIKGREEGATLYIDKLNRYDLWYYADILTSSKVEVSLDGTNWARVDVETKNIQLPDGEAGTDGKLEIKIKYKRYDAVAM